jgi:hypothetical protein
MQNRLCYFCIQLYNAIAVLVMCRVTEKDNFCALIEGLAGDQKQPSTTSSALMWVTPLVWQHCNFTLLLTHRVTLVQQSRSRSTSPTTSFGPSSFWWRWFPTLQLSCSTRWYSERYGSRRSSGGDLWWVRKINNTVVVVKTNKLINPLRWHYCCLLHSVADLHLLKLFYITL